MRAPAFIAFAAAILLGAPAAAAPVSVSDFKSANATIQAAADERSLPTLANPATRAVVQTAFDVGVLERVDWNDSGVAIDVCYRAAMTMLRYAGPPGMLEAAEAGETLAADYGGKYHDELTLGVVFSVDCTAHVAERFVAPFWRRLPADQRTAGRRAGVAQVQEGLGTTYSSAMLGLGAPEFTAENKLLILASLERSAPAFARAAGPAERAKVARTMAELQPHIPAELKPRAQRLADLIANTPCTDLCK